MKSQNFTNPNYVGIDKGEKCLLNNWFLKKGNKLKNKFDKKLKYRIPIIISQPLGGHYIVLMFRLIYLNLKVMLLIKLI